MKITIGIPVKAYLGRYATWKENLEEGEAIDLNGSGEIAWILKGLITGKLQALPHGRQEDFPDIYDAEILTQISTTHYNRGLMFLNLDNVRYFNTYLYRDFHETLLNAIVIMKQYGVPSEQTIWKWMDILDIHELISFDALKKANYRLRKAKDQDNFRCANCLLS